jgi:hypothetical protein
MSHIINIQELSLAEYHHRRLCIHFLFLKEHWLLSFCTSDASALPPPPSPPKVTNIIISIPIAFVEVVCGVGSVCFQRKLVWVCMNLY